MIEATEAQRQELLDKALEAVRAAVHILPELVGGPQGDQAELVLAQCEEVLSIAAFLRVTIHTAGSL